MLNGKKPVSGNISVSNTVLSLFTWIFNITRNTSNQYSIIKVTNQPAIVKTKPSLWSAIIKAGLLAGLLDISGALLNHLISGGRNPGGIFKFIASGIFGNDAFTDGKIMIAWGMLFHFTIAILVTAIYFFIYPKLKFLSKNIVVSGLLYGVVVWLVMNLVVLPLSNTPPLPFKIIGTMVSIVILILAVGLPVSVLAFRYYSKQ